MLHKRKLTKTIKIGGVSVGGSNPVVVQSMLKNRLENQTALLNEIAALQSCGCEIIRIAIVQENSIDTLESLIKQRAFNVPVVADIQFDYRFAIKALIAGADCVRINPGNMPDKSGLVKVALEAKNRNAAIVTKMPMAKVNPACIPILELEMVESAYKVFQK